MHHNTVTETVTKKNGCKNKVSSVKNSNTKGYTWQTDHILTCSVNTATKTINDYILRAETSGNFFEILETQCKIKIYHKPNIKNIFIRDEIKDRFKHKINVWNYIWTQIFLPKMHDTISYSNFTSWILVLVLFIVLGPNAIFSKHSRYRNRILSLKLEPKTTQIFMFLLNN